MGIRDRLTHDYFGVDLTLVSVAVEREVPHSKQQSSSYWPWAEAKPPAGRASVPTSALGDYGRPNEYKWRRKRPQPCNGI